MRQQVGPKGVQGTECKVEDKKPSYGKEGKTTVTSTMSGGGGGGNGDCVLRSLLEGQAGDPDDEDPHRLWQRMTLAADNWELPHAADHLSHFLSGTGEPLDDVDVDTLLRDMPELNAAFNVKLEALRAEAKQRFDNGSPSERFEVSSLDPPVYIPVSVPDWQFALGYFSASVSAETQIAIDDDGHKTVVLRGHLEIVGIYETPPAPLTIAGQTFTDADFALLQKGGCAQIFPFSGKSDKRTIALNRPERDRTTLGQIRKILRGLWLFPSTKSRLVELWESFGSRLLEMAAKHPDLWLQSSRRGARLEKIPLVAKLLQGSSGDEQALSSIAALETSEAPNIDSSVDGSAASASVTETAPSIQIPAVCAQRIAALLRLDGGGAAALRQLVGQPVAAIKSISEQYRVQTGQHLAADFQRYADAETLETARTYLRPTMTLLEKLQSCKHNWWIFNSENEVGMLDMLGSATLQERAQAVDDPEIDDLLAHALSAEQLLEARLLLYKGLEPDDPRLLEAVKERIKRITKNGTMAEVIVVLLELTPEQRRCLWDNEGSNFTPFQILPGSTFKALELACTGSQADALNVGMRLATTDQRAPAALVGSLAQKTGESVRRERELLKELQMLREGGSCDETALQRMAKIERELEALGSVEETLLVPEPDDKNDAGETSFLGRLYGDVSFAEAQQYAAQMGVSNSKLAKQEIVDAIRWNDDDERQIYEAFGPLTPEERAALMKDEEVRAILSKKLNDDEMKLAETYAGADEDAIAQENLRYEFEGKTFGTDVMGVIRGVAELSDAQRKAFAESDLWQEMSDSWAFTEREKSILNELVKTGTLPEEATLEYALGHEVTSRGREFHVGGDGGMEMLELWLAKLPPSQRAEYRLGYWLSRSKPEIESPTDAQHRTAFEELEQRINKEFGGDETQRALDMLLGVPGPEDLSTEAGRRQAADIMLLRVKDKQAQQGSAADWFIEEDETADNAAVEFQAAYKQLLEDGSFSDIDLMMLAHLSQKYDGRYQDYVSSVDSVTAIASQVTAITAGIILTALTGGMAAPLVTAVCTKLGVSSAIITTTIVSVGSAAAEVTVSEILAGEHFDSLGADGQRAALNGVVSAATSMVSGRLMKGFSSLVGLQKRALATKITELAKTSAQATTQQIGGRTLNTTVEEAMKGFLEGALGESVFTALDQSTWDRGVWEALSAFGGRMIEAGLLGARDDILIRTATPPVRSLFGKPKSRSTGGSSETSTQPATSKATGNIELSSDASAGEAPRATDAQTTAGQKQTLGEPDGASDTETTPRTKSEAPKTETPKTEQAQTNTDTPDADKSATVEPDTRKTDADKSANVASDATEISAAKTDANKSGSVDPEAKATTPQKQVSATSGDQRKKVNDSPKSNDSAVKEVWQLGVPWEEKGGSKYRMVEAIYTEEGVSSTLHIETYTANSKWQLNGRASNEKNRIIEAAVTKQIDAELNAKVGNEEISDYIVLTDEEAKGFNIVAAELREIDGELEALVRIVDTKSYDNDYVSLERLPTIGDNLGKNLKKLGKSLDASIDKLRLDPTHENKSRIKKLEAIREAIRATLAKKTTSTSTNTDNAQSKTREAIQIEIYTTTETKISKNVISDLRDKIKEVLEYDALPENKDNKYIPTTIDPEHIKEVGLKEAGSPKPTDFE